ncbi:glycosyltransferase [candidate division KSB1 bacterium]|nr:glycosyltransferase [candidate division KSB1 bacterium]
MVITIAHAFFGEGAVSARARIEARLFLQMGYRVTILTTTLRGLKQFQNDPLRRAHIVTLHPLSLHRCVRKSARELTFAFKCYNYLKRYIEPGDIDFIIYHPAVIALFVERFCKKHKLISIFVAHSLTEEMIRYKVNSLDFLTTLVYRLSEKKAIQNADFVVAISNYMRKGLQSIRKKNSGIVDLPNGIDLSRFTRKWDKERSIDILYAGRLAKEKGVDILFEALGLIPLKPYTCILGEGPEKKRLQALAKKHHLVNVKFTGHISHDQIHTWMWQAKLIVVPSWCEPQGIVLLESMSSGATVVGSDSGAIPECVRHKKNGWLFPVGDSRKLASTIHLLLQNPKERIKLSRKACKTAKEWDNNHFNSAFKKFISGINRTTPRS